MAQGKAHEVRLLCEGSALGSAVQEHVGLLGCALWPVGKGADQIPGLLELTRPIASMARADAVHAVQPVTTVGPSRL